MTSYNTSTSSPAERLEALLRDGIQGTLPIDQLREGLEEVTCVSVGQRFETMTDTGITVVFCAGSWAVGQEHNTDAVATRVTILGETEDGPLEVDLSPQDNIHFGIRPKS